MPEPTKYVPGFSFSGFQTSNPSRPLPAPRLDDELAKVAASVGETVDALADIRRSDGKLQNGIVTEDSLSSGLLFAAAPPQQWEPAKVYGLQTIVAYSNDFYRCIVAHTSSIFVNDRDDGYWEYVVRMQDAVDAAAAAQASELAAAASAEEAAAIVEGAGIPSVPQALNFLRQKSDASGLEYRTPSEVRADIGAQAALGFVAANAAGQDFTGRVGLKKGSTLTAAATLSLGDANYYEVDGNTDISALSSQSAGTLVVLRFNGTPALIHGSSLILPAAANIAASSGDVATLISEGGGVWRLASYQSTQSAVYTGTSATAVDFPVGHTVLVSDGGTVTQRNASATVRVSATNGRYDFGAGTPLAGTWRARGNMSNITLFQRVA